MLSAIPNCPAPHQTANAPVTIGVLGNLNLHKGAMIVDAVAQELSKSGAGRIVLLGETDPELSLKHIKVHGSYVLADLPILVQKYNISKWLMPSIWPETFSFTTFEMIATGLPVYSFDMGAQADALRASLKRGGQGGILTKQGDFPDAQFIAEQLLKFHSPNIDETVEDK
jgi:glycosyltransferase involved in cell wall biosynthesis